MLLLGLGPSTAEFTLREEDNHRFPSSKQEPTHSDACMPVGGGRRKISQPTK
jgi:hypothetical protein